MNDQRRNFWLLVTGLLVTLACALPGLTANTSHLETGRQAYTAGKYDEAIAELTAAVTAEPNNAEAFYLRGAAYYGRYNVAYTNSDPNADGEDFYRAATDFTKAIELNHNYAEAYDFRGLIFYGLHQPDHALADYNEAIRLNANLAEAYYGRGLVYEERGEIQKAIDDYERYLQLDDDAYWRDKVEKRLEKLRALP